ncbi:choline/ethanolamine kinase [Thraustotheca clavata]|uniref:Choline/ethanolamine kinase n=1 Tax=Thraustotheca clavata TaxID=74557 RepID=A0A1V9YK33_9STRA|nr:choline/ethanolamine kinase [Thraustotheca clavata]
MQREAASIVVELSLNGDTNSEKVQNDIVLALQTIVPGWDEVKDIAIVPIQGGQSNYMFSCSRLDKVDKTVMLRVYGHGNESYYDRQDEIDIFRQLARCNIGIGLIGTFGNGRIEKFINGRSLTALDVRKPELLVKIAQKFRQLHSLDIAIDKKPRLMDTLDSWLNLAKSTITPKPVDLNSISDALTRLKSYLSTISSPVVFCHNDLNYSNIMLTHDTNDIIFIDFEFGHYNPRGFDLGNYFGEWCYFMHGPPIEVGDPLTYPSVDQQRQFCKAYLSQTASEQEIEQLRMEANVYTLAAHLYWAVWAIAQSPKSTKEFNYFAYGIGRWQLYQAQENSIVNMQQNYK